MKAADILHRAVLRRKQKENFLLKKITSLEDLCVDVAGSRPYKPDYKPIMEKMFQATDDFLLSINKNYVK